MSIPAETTIEFSEVDLLQTQLEEILEALSDAAGIINATTDAALAPTVDPTGAVSDAAAAVVLAAGLTEWRDSILAGWAALKAEVDGKLEVYDLDPVP